MLDSEGGECSKDFGYTMRAMSKGSQRQRQEGAFRYPRLSISRGKEESSYTRKNLIIAACGLERGGTDTRTLLRLYIASWKNLRQALL